MKVSISSYVSGGRRTSDALGPAVPDRRSSTAPNFWESAALLSTCSAPLLLLVSVVSLFLPQNEPTRIYKPQRVV